MRSSARRDVGFERIGRTTRLLAVGAIVAGGVLSAAVAKALPGKSTHSTSSPTAGTGSAATSGGGTVSGSGVGSGSGGGVTPDSPAQSDPGLNAPSQAPQPSVSPPVVSSGGS